MSAPALSFTVRVNAETLDEIRRLAASAGIDAHSDAAVVQSAVGYGLASELMMLRRLAEIFEEQPT